MYGYFIIYFVLLLPDITYAMKTSKVTLNVIYLIDNSIFVIYMLNIISCLHYY